MRHVVTKYERNQNSLHSPSQIPYNIVENLNKVQSNHPFLEVAKIPRQIVNNIC
jgi:hypothetical protein